MEQLSEVYAQRNFFPALLVFVFGHAASLQGSSALLTVWAIAVSFQSPKAGIGARCEPRPFCFQGF